MSAFGNKEERVSSAKMMVGPVSREYYKGASRGSYGTSCVVGNIRWESSIPRSGCRISLSGGQSGGGRALYHPASRVRVEGGSGYRARGGGIGV